MASGRLQEDMETTRAIQPTILLNLNEVAAQLRWTRRSVEREIQYRRLRAGHLGRSVRVERRGSTRADAPSWPSGYDVDLVTNTNRTVGLTSQTKELDIELEVGFMRTTGSAAPHRSRPAVRLRLRRVQRPQRATCSGTSTETDCSGRR